MSSPVAFVPLPLHEKLSTHAAWAVALSSMLRPKTRKPPMATRAMSPTMTRYSTRFAPRVSRKRAERGA